MAVATVSTSGDNTLLAGTPGKSIVVYRYHMMANGAVNAQFKSSVAGAISGIKYFPAAGAGARDQTLNVSSEWAAANGVFACAVGEDLVLNLSANVAVSLDYQVVLV